MSAAPAHQAKHTVPRVLVRFATGQHLDAKRRTDATFLTRGSQSLVTPRWLGSGRPSRWALMPGWQRAVIRWAVLASAVGLRLAPDVTGWILALAGGPAAGLATWRAWRAWRLWRHRRDIVIPLYAVLSQHIGTPMEERPETWLSVPLDWDTDPEAAVVLEYPAGWDPHPAMRDRIEETVSRHLPVPWDVAWGKARAVWTRAPQPPDVVTFAGMLAEFEAGPEHLVPIGRTTRGKAVRIDIDGEAPHIAFSGGTGAGKSTFIRGVVSYLIHHGAEEVIICDPKRISLSKPFRDVPNVRIFREAEEWPKAIAYVKRRMEERYRWAETQPDEEAAIATFRRLVLVIEEGGSLADMLRTAWKAEKTREDPAEPPALTDLRHILFQGRQGRVTILLVVQQGNAKDMGGSAARDQFGAKVLVNYSLAVWRMMVGTTYVRPPRRKGRGYVVIGDEEQLVQLVNVSAEEAREFALAGNPEAPGAPGSVVSGTNVPDDAASAGAGPDVPDVQPDGAGNGSGEVLRMLRPAPRMLSLTEVCGHLGMNEAAFAKWRQRCRKAGDPLPEPEYFNGRPGWTDDQLEEIADRRAGRRSAG